MKIILLLTLVLSSHPTLANDLPYLSVKDRVRISLWIEGVDEAQEDMSAPVQKPLPEELERVLRKN